ncbi:MAG: hypothetical protein HY075_01020 [Deltaproteobacteria bacterium]|nr:hypothetical protein [Deltaproteobacteria bacterium]
MGFVTATLLRASKWLERSEADRAEILDGRAPRAFYAIFALCFAALALTWGPPFWRSVSHWYRLEPELFLKDADLRVHYGSSPEPCPDIARDSPGCIANSTSPLLWRDGAPRFGADHEERVKKRLWKDFWLGLTLPPETLAAARQLGATQLMLSHLYSSYRIWVNGVFVKAARGSNDPAPILLQLSAADLRSTRPLRVAIHVHFDEEHIPPDHFCDNLPLGFVRPATADQYTFMMRFWECGRPLALALSFTLLAALFFFLWAPSPAKQEYFYLALFSLAAAGWEARWVDFLQRQLEYGTALGIGLANRVALSGFAALLGFSFARTSHRALRVGLALTIIAAACAPLLAPGIQERIAWREALVSTVTPLGFLLGGLACLLQAFAILTARDLAGAIPVRARRLLLFGGGLALVATYYFLDGHKLLPTSFRTFWKGFELLGFMVYFAAIALKEYAEDEALVRKAPVSEYHRRPVLPELINGVLFVADLKSSEPFYKQRAVNRSLDLVGAWRSQVYTAALGLGGTIINRKGDEVIVFFDAEKTPDVVATALKAFADIGRVSELLAGELKRQGLFPPGVDGFYFRASIALGSIRPIWEDMAGHREAYWEEAGNTSPFVEAARTLEMERKAPGTAADRTLLVMLEKVAREAEQASPALARNFVARDFAVRDKHGAEYRVAVLSTDARLKLAA